MRLSYLTAGRWSTHVRTALLVPAGLMGALAMSSPPSADRLPADSAAVDLTPVLGLSGNLRVLDLTPLVDLVPGFPPRPGLHPSELVAPDGMAMHTLELVPLVTKRAATWHGYRVGFWPGERREGRRRSRYPLPAGFLEVTRENQDVPLSTRFRVRDFLTKDQFEVWPKLLVIQMRLVDKLELIAEELERAGRPGSLSVMSGFRTPQYNALGTGPRGGRARDSRHMYGDAADIFVDADGDGRMDDLDHDGRVTIADARWLAAAASRVEARFPDVRGGIGVYRATSAHGPFVHVDTRGSVARW